MKPAALLFLLVAAVVGATLLAWAAVPAGAWWLHSRQRFDEEIAWLSGLGAVLPLGERLDPTLDRLHRGRVERELRAGRVDRAVQAMRSARAHAARPGAARDPKLVALGLETYARASERLERHGRLSLAADWCDTLFTFGIRDADRDVRLQAAAAFLEGLDLRVRDGRPCAALARWDWAKRGLGGEVPEIQPMVEDELRARCARSRGNR